MNDTPAKMCNTGWTKFLRRISPGLGIFIFVLIAGACSGQKSRSDEASKGSKVQAGAEVLLEKHLPTLRQHKVGLVMNPTARVKGVHMLDTLLAHDIPVSALFAPEHGFRGRAEAGERIKDGVDQQTGLPVYSLYGDTRKPTPEMLKKVDLLLFDIQDVGARFYTYHVTLGKVIEAAARAGIPVWVLDRPNPAGGKYVAGWLLREKFRSFVGAYPIPVVHGMTMGELARMMVGESWIEHAGKAEVKVIRMKNWKREMLWPETGLRWYPPSPNLPRFSNAYFYLGTAFFEGTNLSEGRGTDAPFLKLGSPTTNIPDSVINRLEKSAPVDIKKITFTPRSIPGKSVHPKFEGEKVKGIRLSLKGNPDQVKPLEFGLELLRQMIKYTSSVTYKEHLFRLAGTKKIKAYLKGESQKQSLPESWEEDVNSFKKQRKPYLLYK